MRMSKIVLSMMVLGATCAVQAEELTGDRKSTRLNSSH